MLHLDLGKLLQNANALGKRMECCETCGSKKKKCGFYLEVFLENCQIGCVHRANFCSTSCFRQWRRSGHGTFELEEDGKNPRQKFLHKLAHATLSRRNSNLLTTQRIRQEIKKAIFNYGLRELCDRCHSPRNKNYFLTVRSNTESRLREMYCSKRCLIQAVQEKVSL